jgi:hypothetical protein
MKFCVCSPKNQKLHPEYINALLNPMVNLRVRPQNSQQEAEAANCNKNAEHFHLMDFSSSLCQTFHKNKSRKDLSSKKNGSRVFSYYKGDFSMSKIPRSFIDAQYTMGNRRK